MESLRLDTLAAQVVAWHNRHPLARRIAAAQVHSMGYVVLPGMQLQPQAAAKNQNLLPTGNAAVDVGPAAAPEEPEPEVVAKPSVADAGTGAHAAADADAGTGADADAVADAEAPGATPATLAQQPGAAATVPASEPAAGPTRAAASAGDPAAAPSLRERLASRPAQVLPEPPLRAKPMLAPPAALPVPAGAAPVSQMAGATLRLAFSERFLEHVDTCRVAAWALQQARVLMVALPAGAAVRRVQREASLSVVAPGAHEIPVDLVLRTATLEVGRHRQRLLIGPGDDPAVLGSRAWSLPRLALACLPVLLLPLTAGTAWWLGAQSVQPSPALAAAAQLAAPAASAVAATSAVAVAGSAPAARGHAGAHVPAAADPNRAHPPPDAAVAFAAYAASAVASSAAAAVVANAPPEDTEPRLGRVELPPLGPLFSDPRFEPTMQRRLAARAARAASNEAGASRPAAAAPATTTTTAAATPAVSPAMSVAPPTAAAEVSAPKSAPATAAAPPPAAAFALSTRLLRTAAESEQVQVAMRTLLAVMLEGSARVQRVPVGDDWRVMGGPFASRAAADKARAQLLARGVKTEVVEIPPAATVAAAASPVR